MSNQSARIVGHVTYTEGDGMPVVIPPGPCEITVTSRDVTIAWIEGDAHGLTALPLDEYTRYLTSGAIVLLKPEKPEKPK